MSRKDLYLRSNCSGTVVYKRLKDLLFRLGTEGECDFRAYDSLHDLRQGMAGALMRMQTMNCIKTLWVSSTQFSYPKPIHTVTHGIAMLAVVGAITKPYWSWTIFLAPALQATPSSTSIARDGGQRKFRPGQNMGDYFDTVLLPRIKKVTFTPEWRDGKPKRLATSRGG